MKNTSKQSHRTCVRMSAKDYDLLKKKSTAAGLSANAWLMAQLAANRPILHREEETWDAIHFKESSIPVPAGRAYSLPVLFPTILSKAKKIGYVLTG